MIWVPLQPLHFQTRVPKQLFTSTSKPQLGNPNAEMVLVVVVVVVVEITEPSMVDDDDDDGDL